MVRAVVAAMGCGFGAAMQDLINKATTDLPIHQEVGSAPSLLDHSPISTLSTENDRACTGESSPLGAGVHLTSESGTHEGLPCEEDVAGELHCENPGDTVDNFDTWGPRGPSQLVSSREAQGSPPASPGAGKGFFFPPTQGGESCFLSEEELHAFTVEKGVDSTCTSGEHMESCSVFGKESAKAALSGEEDAVLEEKAKDPVRSQAGVGLPRTVPQQSAWWLTFKDADLETRFLAFQAASSRPVCTRLVPLVMFVIISNLP
jgi:hypothetical protein